MVDGYDKYCGLWLKLKFDAFTTNKVVDGEACIDMEKINTANINS